MNISIVVSELLLLDVKEIRFIYGFQNDNIQLPEKIKSKTNYFCQQKTKEIFM